MFGKNKISKPQNHQGDFLNIQEIFHTFQGEGPFCLNPAIFIRLGGCNLACKFCDTEFDNYQKLSLKQITQEVKKISKKYPNTKLIILTGGEPLIQPINQLCQILLEQNFTIQIETNGTIYRKLPKEIKIICSPKVTNNKYHNIREDLLPDITAFKFLISKTLKNYQSIPNIGQFKYNSAIYVQPIDEYDEVKNKNNLEYAKSLCLKNGYNLSLQLHKIIGVK